MEVCSGAYYCNVMDTESDCRPSGWSQATVLLSTHIARMHVHFAECTSHLHMREKPHLEYIEMSVYMYMHIANSG